VYNPDSQTRQRVIMFDGPDGVGKSTQLEKTKDWLQNQGRTVIGTRLSGGTEIGEALRTISLNPAFKRPAITDMYLMLAMYSAVADSIRSDNNPDDTIYLIDRSPLSIIAYQVYGSGLSAELAAKAVTDSLKDLRPDLIICYEADTKKINEQLASRHNASNDYFENQPTDYAERVIEGYRAAAQEYGASIIIVNDEPDAIFTRTKEVIASTI
jgi:dTMP kinase